MEGGNELELLQDLSWRMILGTPSSSSRIIYDYSAASVPAVLKSLQPDHHSVKLPFALVAITATLLPCHFTLIPALQDPKVVAEKVFK